VKTDGTTGDFVSEWLERGLTITAMIELLKWVLAEYRLAGDGNSEGKGLTG
jgi:hypothetical protein